MSISDMIKKLSSEKAVVESLKNLANKRALTGNEKAVIETAKKVGNAGRQVSNG